MAPQLLHWMSLKCLSVVVVLAAVIDAIRRLKTKPCLRFPGGFLPIAISLIKSQEHLMEDQIQKTRSSLIRWNDDGGGSESEARQRKCWGLLFYCCRLKWWVEFPRYCEILCRYVLMMGWNSHTTRVGLSTFTVFLPLIGQEGDLVISDWRTDCRLVTRLNVNIVNVSPITYHPCIVRFTWENGKCIDIRQMLFNRTKTVDGDGLDKATCFSRR